MRVSVSEKTVIITENSQVNYGEHGVNMCLFTLPECFKDLYVTAVFDGIPVPVSGGECVIPSLKKGNVTLGVYAYKKTGDQVEVMYSPRPTVFYVGEGSFCEEEMAEDVPTVGRFEEYCNAVIMRLSQFLENSKSLILEGTCPALRGYSQGSAVRLDDVSPFPHKVKVNFVNESGEAVSGITAKICGKNLFDGVTTDGNSSPQIYRRVEMFLPVGKYTLSFSEDVYFQAKSNNVTYTRTGNRIFYLTVTEAGKSFVQFRLNESSTTPWDSSVKIQLEIGNVATQFQEYVGQIRELASGENGFEADALHPCMSVLPLSADIVAQVSYNRDINMVIPLLEASAVKGGEV